MSSPDSRPAISEWLSPGTRAWRRPLTPLSPARQRLFVDTLLAYETALTTVPDPAPTE